MASKLKATYEVLTPLYMGDAEQAAELRAPSFKGLLRFWYRAIDPGYAESNRKHGNIAEESALFGGSGAYAGQSPFVLRIFSDSPETWRWDAQWAKGFSKGYGKNAKNGLIYLGFPFHMGKRGMAPRTAISPGHTFQIRLSLLRGDEEKTRQRIASAIWLLGHLGGGGGRNRRGFGSLALKSWDSEPGNSWPELQQLRLLCEGASLSEWASGFMEALELFKGWFGAYPNGFHHPHIGPRFKVFPMADEFSKFDWAASLNFMGGLLQEYRQRKDPDYTDVKNHLLAVNKSRGAYLEYTPERASFGLPLRFWYSSLPRQMRWKNVGLAPFDTAGKMQQLERHGSLLFLRPVLVKERLYPVFFRLDGDVPGHTPPGSVQNWRTPLSPCRNNAMDDFLSWLRTR